MDLLRPIYLRGLEWGPYGPSGEPYALALPAVQAITRLSFDQPVTILVGENGTGKSTLVETIAVLMGMNAEGGSEGMRFATRETHTRLHRALRAIRGAVWPDTCYFLRAESFYNVATEVDTLSKEGPGPLTSHGPRSLHEQSHGESFLALANHRFRSRGFYVLDEPEAALSPLRQLSLLRRMKDLVEERCQFVLATHSPILMAFPGAAIYELTPEGVERVTWDAVEHVRLTREFLRAPEKVLDVLFAPREAATPEGVDRRPDPEEDPGWERPEGRALGWRGRWTALEKARREAAEAEEEAKAAKRPARARRKRGEA